MNWFDEEAMTTVEKVFHHEETSSPKCMCSLCTLINEENAAQRVERHLRTLLLDMGRMDDQELVCVRKHLVEMKGGVSPAVVHLHHALDHLAKFADHFRLQLRLADHFQSGCKS